MTLLSHVRMQSEEDLCFIDVLAHMYVEGNQLIAQLTTNLAYIDCHDLYGSLRPGDILHEWPVGMNFEMPIEMHWDVVRSELKGQDDWVRVDDGEVCDSGMDRIFRIVDVERELLQQG